jgi:hypothetical protein
MLLGQQANIRNLNNIKTQSSQTGPNNWKFGRFEHCSRPSFIRVESVSNLICMPRKPANQPVLPKTPQLPQGRSKSTGQKQIKLTVEVTAHIILQPHIVEVISSFASSRQ